MMPVTVADQLGHGLIEHWWWAGKYEDHLMSNDGLGDLYSVLLWSLCRSLDDSLDGSLRDTLRLDLERYIDE